MSFINVDLTQLLVDAANEEDKKAYETTKKTFNCGFTHADFIIYILGMYNDELASLMEDIPEEYAQDLHTAWDAISRVIFKMKGERK